MVDRGAGIYHRNAAACGQLLGVQLWLNLPAKNKMVPFKYRDVSRRTSLLLTRGR